MPKNQSYNKLINRTRRLSCDLKFYACWDLQRNYSFTLYFTPKCSNRRFRENRPMLLRVGNHRMEIPYDSLHTVEYRVVC